MFAPLKLLRKLIDVINRSVVPQLFSAANRNPWFAKNTHATDFFCSIELICLICWPHGVTSKLNGRYSNYLRQ